MIHPKKGSRVKLIKLEAGMSELKAFMGKIGTVTNCDKYGTRRFYETRFESPWPEIIYLYRPEIEVIEE